MKYFYLLITLQLINNVNIKTINCAKLVKFFNQTTSSSLRNDIIKSKQAKNKLVYTPSEERLLKYLFRDYNPHIMPRENFNESFKLYMGLAMVQLINIYDKEQVMKTNVWLHLLWNDPYLQWSHINEFRHIISIRVPFENVWTPDIILFNNAHGKYDVSYKCNVVLYQQGGVLWIPPAIYKSSCQINVKYFPFDQQECEMIFGSWVYNIDEFMMDYFENMKHVDLNDYVPSGTWDLIDVPASIEYYYDTNTNKSKALMVYKIKMKRKSLFYTVNIIIPTFLISFLSVCVFYLPTDDGEKITLSISILFALVVFFLLIAKIIPPTSIVVPLISKYLLFTFIMNILSVLNTCVVISLYYKKLKIDDISPWVRKLFIEFMPRILFIKRRKRNNYLTKYSLLSNESSHYPNRFEDDTNSPLFSVASKLEKHKHKNIKIKEQSNRKELYNLDGEFEFDFPLIKKFNSQHDLILSSDLKKFKSSPTTTERNKFTLFKNKKSTRLNESIYEERYKSESENSFVVNRNRSNLYNLDKFQKTPDTIKSVLKNKNSNENFLWPKLSKNDQRKTQSSKSLDNRKIYSINTIKLTERFIQVSKSIEYIANLMKAQAELTEIKEDWKYIAAVFDRLNLILFFVVTCVGTYASLFDAPYLFENFDEQNLIKTYSHKLIKP